MVDVSQIKEHAEVIGADGVHVGTVDHVDGDRIKLTKNDSPSTEDGQGQWFGAFLGDRLVSSMGLIRAGEGLARFQEVLTHPDARGRGLAGTLVHHVSRFGFDELGVETLVMVADPDYLAIRIYRSVGFEDTETQLAALAPPR